MAIVVFDENARKMCFCLHTEQTRYVNVSLNNSCFKLGGRGVVGRGHVLLMQKSQKACSNMGHDINKKNFFLFTMWISLNILKGGEVLIPWRFVFVIFYEFVYPKHFCHKVLKVKMREKPRYLWIEIASWEKK